MSEPGEHPRRPDDPPGTPPDGSPDAGAGGRPARRRRWWDTPGAGRPELHWRVVHAVTLVFAITVVVAFVAYGLVIAGLLVAFVTSSSAAGSNK